MKPTSGRWHSHAYQGLSQEQRLRVRAELMAHDAVKTTRMRSTLDGPNRPAEGWYIYRIPTTVHPPTTLRLHYRSATGKLLQVISITENGVTRRCPR